MRTQRRAGRVVPVVVALGLSGLLAAVCLGAASAKAAQAPTAEISINPGHDQLQVTFTAESVGFPSAVVSYEWKFGDGAVEGTSTHTVSHTYLRASTYTASVTEKDSKGDTATTHGTLTLFVCKAAATCTQQVKNEGNVLTLLASGPIVKTAAATVDMFVDPFQISGCEPQVATAVALTDAGFTGDLTVTLDYMTHFPKQVGTTCFNSKAPFTDAAGKSVTSGALPACQKKAVAPCVKSVGLAGATVSKVILIPPGDPKVGAP